MLLCVFNGYAQDQEHEEELANWQLRKLGKKALKVQDVYSAIDYYTELCEKKPEQMKFAFKLAELHRRSRNYTAAEAWYGKVDSIAPGRYPEALFWRAIMLRRLGEHQKAKDSLLVAKKSIRGAADEKVLKKLLKSNLEGIELVEAWKAFPAKIIVDHMDTSINKAHIELSPMALSEDEMLFASMRSDDIVYVVNADTVKERPVRQFYSAKKVDGKWRFDGRYPAPFNIAGKDVGNGALSVDGNRFYFSMCEPDFQGVYHCDLYVSNKEEGAWGEPAKMAEPINLKDYNSSMPTVGLESKKQQEVIYFVSDRPGGKGGKDIWFTVYDKRKKTFKDPKKAGNKVNSIGDELTPYYDMDTRTLYYATDGWPGMGGLDIHKAQGELTKWTLNENIGAPINTEADELYYTIAPSREEGFFVSNRTGGVVLKHETCCDDLYTFKYPEFVHIATNGKVELLADSASSDIDVEAYKELGFNDAQIDSIVALKQSTEQQDVPLENTQVSLYLVNDSLGEPLFVKSTSTDEKGNYFFKLEQGNNYEIVASRNGFFSDKSKLTTAEVTKSDTLEGRTISLQPMSKKPLVIKNVYYPYDKAHLTDSVQQTLRDNLLSVLLINPTLIVEISSHTDSKGSDKYNEKLSQERAESVVKFLIANGVPKQRLVAKGYGESQPLAANENEDGSDNPEGRAKNRRTEFRVIGVLDEYSDVIYEE